MAGQIFLYLDGIPGESTSAYCENWIDVESFSIGVTMPVDQEARTGSGGGTSGAADPEDFEFNMKMTIATPVLMQCCAAGALIPRGRILQFNIVNESPHMVSDYALGESIITEVTVDASGGEIANQTLKINYGSIVWRYYAYSHFNPSKFRIESRRTWNVLEADPYSQNVGSSGAEDAMAEILPGGTHDLAEYANGYSTFFKGGVDFSPGPVAPIDRGPNG